MNADDKAPEPEEPPKPKVKALSEMTLAEANQAWREAAAKTLAKNNGKPPKVW